MLKYTIEYIVYQLSSSCCILIIWVIRLYQLIFSSWLAPCCRFYPSCSRYAIIVLQQHNVIKALYLIIWRLLRCQPWSAGGYDMPSTLNKPNNNSLRKIIKG